MSNDFQPNRHRASIEAGVEPRLDAYTGNDPITFMLSLNLHRRHLNESQRATVAAKLANLARGSNQHLSRLAHDPQTGETFHLGVVPAPAPETRRSSGGPSRETAGFRR